MSTLPDSSMVIDGHVLGGIYCGVLVLGSLQLGRTCWSKTRRIWSLQSAFLAMCMAWTACRAIYFTLVFEKSESCAGFVCVGGSQDGSVCNAARLHPVTPPQCPDGVCTSSSTMSCSLQHILFGLPTMIQSIMLSTLIVFYAYWVHKANGKMYRCHARHMHSHFCCVLGHVVDVSICRRRVLILCSLCNGVYYLCFLAWVLVVRCGNTSAVWMYCETCREIMSGMTALLFFVLCGALGYFSWRLYTHSRRVQPSSQSAPSGRRTILLINIAIVVLFASHGVLSLLSLAPDRQDIVPCPLRMFPDFLMILIGEILPTVLLVLHFRRISRPTMGPMKEAIDASGRTEPTRPEEAYVDFTSSDSDSEESSDAEASLGEAGFNGKQALFDDANRYEHSLHGVFQSSPCFNNTTTMQGRMAPGPGKAARVLTFGGGQGLDRPLLDEDGEYGKKKNQAGARR